MPTLNWIGKDKVVNHHRDVPFKVLDHQYRFTADGGVNSPPGKEGSGEVGNKIIHGDNLEALKSLLPEYEGKIKCIYIDPPYNTGNEGWVYNDNVNDPKIKKWLGQVVGKESEDLSRHDKWLCMMYPRLKLLRKLLADDGAIFISIDDNEQANLRLLMEEVFGGGNFIDTVIWQKIFTIKNSAKYFSDMHEYLLVYARNKQAWKINLLGRTDKADQGYSNPDNDARGPWTTNAIQARNHYDAGHYPITSPKGKEHLPPKGTSWRVSEDNYKALVQDNRIWWGSNGDSIPRIKKFLNEAKDGIVPSTLWLHKDAGQNAGAKATLREILEGSNESLFNTPKPTKLIEKVLELGSNRDSIILDSFAGSGTTAHAVLNANKADGGNRKFILIEMEDYADTITAERVKRVMKGYGEGNKKTEGTGGSFDYYSLGKPLFIGENNEFLNEEVGLAAIRNYVWYSETRSALSESVIASTPKGAKQSPEKYLLGTKDDTAYYFVYEKDSLTSLNHEFLATIKTEAQQYIIYADNCLLSKEFLQQHNIIFKKIPRDITRF
jgi:adenine-specific DNA-methyltransferase